MHIGERTRAGGQATDRTGRPPDAPTGRASGRAGGQAGDLVDVQTRASYRLAYRPAAIRAFFFYI